MHDGAGRAVFVSRIVRALEESVSRAASDTASSRNADADATEAVPRVSSTTAGESGRKRMGRSDGIGVVCSDGKIQHVLHLSLEARVGVAWVEVSLERAVTRASCATAIIIEWAFDNLYFRDRLSPLLGSASRPSVIVVGSADRRDIFELAKAGVDAYFETFSVEAFRAAAAVAPQAPQQRLREAARANLGLLGVKDAQKVVRAEMFREALTAHGGNRHAAARVLGVDRRYVLKMVRDDDLPRYALKPSK